MIRPLVFSLVVGVVVPSSAEAEKGFTGTVTCVAPRIVDGDTFVCNDERIRLWGVNSPERGKPGFTEAGEHLKQLTKSSVKCNGKYRDRWQRLVSWCTNSKGDLAAQMVRAGHAVDYPRYSKGYYRGVR